MKKIASLILALMLVLAMAVPAMAEDGHTITVTYPNAGHTYEAYQVFSGTWSENEKVLSNIFWGDGVDLEKPVDEKTLMEALVAESIFANCTTAADVAGVLAKKETTSENLDTFANIVAKYLKEAGKHTSDAGTKGVEDYEYVISGLADGYYLVKDKDESVGTNDAYTKFILEVVDDVRVKAKADVPELDKVIVEEIKGVKTDVDENEASIGEKVNYKLTSKVPEMDGYEKYYFIVHDKLSEGLTFNDDVAIKVGEKNLEEDKDFFVTETDGQIKIVFNNFIQYKGMAKTDIVITYSATLNENAVIGGEGNPNVANLEYSNNPNVALKGENEPAEGDGDVTGITPPVTVITYVTGIKVVKVDEENKILPGAKFQISGLSMNIVIINEEVFEESAEGTYYRLTDGTYTETAPTADTKEKYESTDKKYKKVENVVEDTVATNFVTEGWVDADGVLTFEGLGAGTYTITELVAPDGYNMLDEPITVVIDWVVVNEETGEKGFSYSGVEDGKVEDGLYSFAVVNKPGKLLPSTGGMGTTMFYVAGGLLIAVAIVALITKKRMVSAK